MYRSREEPSNNDYTIDTDMIKLPYKDRCTLIGLLTMVNQSKKANDNSIRLEKIVRQQILQEYVAN